MAEEEEERKWVLVVGGSGYLGQHLLAALASAAGCLDVAFTHHSQAPPQPLLDALPSVRAIRANSSAALASSQHQPAYDLTFSSAAAHPVSGTPWPLCRRCPPPTW